MFEEVTHIGDWSSARKALESPGFVAMEDNGVIDEGDYVVITEDPGIEGLYIESDLFNGESSFINRDEREGGGFYFRNSDNSPVELKYRFSEELREYPELIHAHNTPELYVPRGSFEMNLASKDAESGFVNVEFDEPLIVPAGMYHGIQSREPGSQLIVARGDPELQEEVVGKWDIDQNQLYSHVEGLELPELKYYEEEADEMHNLW